MLTGYLCQHDKIVQKHFAVLIVGMQHPTTWVPLTDLMGQDEENYSGIL